MELLKRIKRFEVSIALLLCFTPLILWQIEGVQRDSISNYAYSKISHIFNFLLNLGGFLFVFNSIINKKHFYNLILGLSLMGVGLTPHLDFSILHYTFAGIFFIGSCIAIPLSTNKKYFYQKIAMSIVIITCLCLHFFFNYFSLFVAEWLGIIPISIHFIIKSLTHVTDTAYTPKRNFKFRFK